MKHRSPLITLAAVALAFAIMFIVNMTVSPPGNSSSGMRDGSQVGVQTTGPDSTAAPELNPGNPQITVDGENLNAAPVNGDEGL